MKILTLDIETAPATAYVWGPWKQDIGPHQIIKPKHTISFAAKWHGDKQVLFRSVHHHSKRAMLDEAHRLLGEADVVVGYNSKSFDIPHLNTEFWHAGLGPPRPFHQIDLLKTVRSKFSLFHNKLGVVAEQKGIGSKVEHEGFALWVACMEGDAKAWSRMRKYNRQDVVLTEQLYDELLPWIENHPSHGAFSGTNVCRRCGSAALERRGVVIAATRRYQQYRCKDCGGWGRYTKSDGGTEMA